METETAPTAVPTETIVTKFMHLRDKENRPVVTLCRVSLSGICGYGWAICSPSDNPCRKTGKLFAEKRARAALNKAINTDKRHEFWNRWILRPEALYTLDSLSEKDNTAWDKFWDTELFHDKGAQYVS